MNEFLATVGEWWLTWLLGLIGTGILAGFRVLYKRQQAAEVRQTALENGVQAILRDSILTSYYHYHDKGKITLHGLENVEAMYRSYHDLGGNGTMTHLVEVLREMEVVDD